MRISNMNNKQYYFYNNTKLAGFRVWIKKKIWMKIYTRTFDVLCGNLYNIYLQIYYLDSVLIQVCYKVL